MCKRACPRILSIDKITRRVIVDASARFRGLVAYEAATSALTRRFCSVFEGGVDKSAEICDDFGAGRVSSAKRFVPLRGSRDSRGGRAEFGELKWLMV